MNFLKYFSWLAFLLVLGSSFFVENIFGANDELLDLETNLTFSETVFQIASYIAVFVGILTGIGRVVGWVSGKVFFRVIVVCLLVWFGPDLVTWIRNFFL